MVLSAPSRVKLGKEPSKSLFMKLRLLKLGNLERASTSIIPCKAIFSSCSPQTSPLSHTTPFQPLHGEVEASQLANAAVFLRDSLNLSRTLPSDSLKETHRLRRRRKIGVFERTASCLRIIMVGGGARTCECAHCEEET